jgi:hypothetical protein
VTVLSETRVALSRSHSAWAEAWVPNSITLPLRVMAAQANDDREWRVARTCQDMGAGVLF